MTEPRGSLPASSSPRGVSRIVAPLSRTLSLLPLRLGERGSMILIAVTIGIAGGFGAVFFRWLIHALQDLAWGRAGNPLEKILGVTWYVRLLVPTVGGLIVGAIVKFLAPEAKGHGVPEVMNAVARQGGVIRPVVAVAKSLASATCIASGGSVGREGPIVQIGSAVGSTVGQALRLPTRRIRICVACGAAAGIAATFNAPIAGAFFASEIILGEFGAGAFSSAVISSVTATVISHTFLGDVLAFSIPHYVLASPVEMIPYAVLGLLAGVAGVVFVTVLNAAEDLFDSLRRIPSILQAGLGGLAIGAIGLVLPQVMGVGYETITAALNVKLALGMMLALFAAKLVATCLTLGSGGSGGIFAPSLFMGAALGGAVGQLASRVLPAQIPSPGAYAVVGMGAMVAAATHAPITAIVIIFEMTGDYRVILGLMVSATLATLVAQRLRRESIYTIKLLRRGIDLHAGQEVNVLRQVRVGGTHRADIETVPLGAPLDELYRRMVESPHYEFFTVDERGNLSGVISVDDLRHLLPQRERLRVVAIAADVARPAVFVREDDTLDTAMRQFGRNPYEELPVLPAGDSMRPVGTIRRQDVISAYNREILRVDLAGSFSARISSAAQLRTWETLGGFVLAQTDAPPHLCDRPLGLLELRRKQGLLVVLIERSDTSAEHRFVLPSRDSILRVGDRVVVFGRREDVASLVGAPG